MDEREAAETRARNRFMAINVVRISGVLMVLAGLAVMNGALDLPEVVAWGLIGLGLAEVFIFPTLLSRKWSTNNPEDRRRR